MSATGLPLHQIAAEINQHLQRMERDPHINRRAGDRQPSGWLWNSNAHQSGNRCFIRYISYQYTASLTKSEAEQYLEGLRNGFQGRHYEFFRRGNK